MSRELTPEACKCDWATGECQGPIGCKAVAEIERLRAFTEQYDQIDLERIADIRRLEATLVHTRTFLKTYQRSNAVWHNDRPTFDFIHNVIDPALAGKEG